MRRKVKIIISLSVVLLFMIGAGILLNKYIFADLDRSDNTTGAENYLTGLKNKITFDYWDGIVKKGDLEKSILANISNDNSLDDYEAFTRIRARIFNYISDLKGYNIQVPEPAKNTSKITVEPAPQKDETGVNLLENGGFEENVKGIPIGWQDQWKAGGDKTLDGRIKRSGQKSWKFEQKSEVGYQSALSDFIPIREDKTYKFSAWIRTQQRTKALVQWFEYEDNTSTDLPKPNTTQIGSSMNENNQFATEGKWIKYTSGIRLKDAKTKFIRIKIASGEGDLWWDDLSLVNVGSDYLGSLGCENSASSKCVDVGSSSESAGGIITDIDNKMTGKTVEGNVNSRAIKPRQKIEINIPSFDIDQNGVPKNPMMLEIRFKDTLKYDDIRKSDFNVKATVFSKINYISKAPTLYGYQTNFDGKCAKSDPGPNEPDECYPTDRVDYPIAYLGELNDGKWKYIQYSFLKEFPLIRSINGKFTFNIQMPLVKDFETAELPIDYITVKKVSQDQIDRLEQKQRELRGFYKVEFKDEPKTTNYSQKELIVFSRDNMRPVFESTKPQPGEITDSISAFSTLGEIEPANFAIYSGDGVNNLSFSISDLNGKTDKIAKENVSLQKVVLDEMRLNARGSLNYALVPDRLEDFKTLSVKPQTSQRLWLKIRVPDKLKGGDYEGKIKIAKDGSPVSQIKFKITVLPIKLDQPKSASFTSGDPFSRTFSNNLEELYKVYNDYQVSTAIHLHQADYKIIKNADQIVDIDFEKFRQRIADFKRRGILIEDQPVVIRGFTNILVVAAHPGAKLSDPDLFAKLTDDKFAVLFKNAISKMIQIGKENGISFVFEIADEPNTAFERIIADRTYPLVKSAGGKTWVTLQGSSEYDLTEEKAAPYQIPKEFLPLKPLSKQDFVDYKVWNLVQLGSAYQAKYSGSYGYYTTHSSYLGTPLNNRFLHGFLAYKTDAEMVFAYTFGAWWNDPYKDYDSCPEYTFYTTESDRILTYPSWEGKLIPRMAAEGLREGIKDAKYIATLKDLIAKNKEKMIHPNGTLIKANDAPEIYLLEENKKRHIPSWSVFASQFNSRAVVIVSSSEVNNYPLGEPLKYQDGALFKTQDNPMVYVVENGKKRHIPTPEIFASMGYNWGAIIIAEDNNIADLHPTGESISPTAAHPDGTLVKTDSSPSVYLLEKGKKRHIPAPSIFTSRFIFWNRMVLISASELDSYPLAADVPYRDGTLFQVIGDPAVYAVESGQKRHISSPAVFARLGYKWENIIMAEDESIADLHPLSSPLN